MLGTFPKAFSSNFPRVFFHVATSQMQFPKRQLPKSVLAAELGPHCSLCGGASEGLILPSESCRLGNCTFGKLPLGKLSLRKKYLTPN